MARRATATAIGGEKKRTIKPASGADVEMRTIKRIVRLLGSDPAAARRIMAYVTDIVENPPPDPQITLPGVE